MTLPPRVDHNVARLAAQTMVQLRDQQTKKVSGEVITRLTGLPALLRTSGPLATLAFFVSKAKPGSDKPLPRAYAAVGSALRTQLAGELGLTFEEDASLTSFVLALTEETIPPDALVRATARLEEFALWLRRLAEAVDQEQSRA